MKIQVKILLFSLCVLSCLSTLEGGASVDYLDESTLFEISWPGKQKVAACSVKYVMCPKDKGASFHEINSHERDDLVAIDLVRIDLVTPSQDKE